MNNEKHPKLKERLTNCSLIANILSVGVISYILFAGLKTRQQKKTLRINENNLNGLNSREAAVAKKLLRIFTGLDLLIAYESVSLEKTGEDEGKQLTLPDFHFSLNGIKIFIEVGAVDNHTSRKNSQFSVVENGIESGGKIPDLIYVQLDDDDIEELENNVFKIPEFLEYLQTREIKIIYIK